jgi:hypothetical protein
MEQIMAYYQLYYKEIESHGNDWRVEIWQDTEDTLDTLEIGPVLQGLRLVVQGDQADIDTPIVKTSLEMVFVDAPELELGKTDRKCGDWEEFYTSSATEYQVRLYKNGSIEWTGYITPDSFSEDLRYRGSVTIIARDNLGTLQDTTCDLRDLQNADGKVYIADVIGRAFQVSTCGMALNYDYNTFPFACVESQQWEYSGKVFYQMVDAAYLGEMSWWEALEAVLYSIGGVMRYIGGNQFFLSTLRDLPKLGKADWWGVPVKPATFLAYGHRELVPAVKSITETQEWETVLDNEVESLTNYEGTATLACTNIYLQGPSGTMANFNVPAWGYTNARTREAVTAANSGLLNVKNYAKVAGYDQETWGAWDDESIIYMAVNTRVDKPLTFSKRIYTSKGEDSIAGETPAKVKVGFDLGYGVSLTQDYFRVLNFPLGGIDIYPSASGVDYTIKHTDLAGGNAKYYNTSKGEWSSSKVTNVANGMAALTAVRRATEYDFEIELPAVGIITLEITRWYINGINISTLVDVVGLFGRISNIHIDAVLPEDMELLKKRTITTNYSDRHSVRLQRDPKLAVNPSTLPEVAYITNAILIEGGEQYLGSDDWVWMHGREWDEIPAHTGAMLTRLIHQQLLCWHSKPSNLLTGEIACEDPAFNALYEWNGKKHHLISGTLNCLTGRMEGATLREFERYDHLWETYAEQDVYQLERSNTEQVVDIVVRSSKTLKISDIKGLGGQLLNYGMTTSGNKYTFHIGVAPINEPFERVVTIDTARVLIRVI